MEIDWAIRKNLPSKVVGIRRNFRSASPNDQEVTAEPRFYVKPPSSVTGDGADILIPRGVDEIVAEVELALIVGIEARDLSSEDAARAIRGVVCGNDMTALDLFREDGELARAKGLDGFCPLSRHAVPFSAVANGVTLRCYVNGELRQEGNTRDMIFAAPQVVAFVSSWFTLWPGDVVLLGTPSVPPRIGPGDVIKVEAEGIGSVTNRLVRHDGRRQSRPLHASG